MDEATLIFLAGLTAVALALLAWFADRKRSRRRDPDAVGFMPWTTIFFWAFLAALLLLALAGKDWLGGSHVS